MAQTDRGADASVPDEAGIPSDALGADATLAADLGLVAPNGWRALSGGGRHTCGITTAGLLYCWGDNEFGQLGVHPGPTNDGLRRTSAPQQITRGGAAGAVDGEFIAVSAGFTHACAVFDEGSAGDTSDDSLWCWGNDALGQVSGAPGDEAPPGRIDPNGLAGFTAVSAGRDHTCALRAGELWCWGDNERGQLGNDTCGQSPRGLIQVQSDGGFQQVAAGWDTTCAIRADGALLCWGSDDSGRLGDGPRDSSCAWPPVTIAEPAGAGCAGGWASVSTFESHVCAIHCREVYCWGRDNEGQVFEPGSPDQNTPRRRTGGEANWRAVTAGGNHTCALDDDGDVTCWGWNGSGELGGGVGANAPARPALGAETWTGVDSGGGHTCGLLEGGRAACWGESGQGQSGRTPAADGAGEPVDLISDHHRPARVQDPVGVEGPWTAIGLGLHHTCGVKDGRLFCWGRNVQDELAAIDVTRRRPLYETPVEVMANVVSVEVGEYSTCAINPGGQADCWPHASPRLPGLWKQIAVGHQFACGIQVVNQGDETGDVCCWTSDENDPVCLNNGTRWRAVSALSGVCALDETGHLFCWNEQTLGEYCEQPRHSPLAISPGRTFLDVSVSLGPYACAVDTSHGLFCGQWGLGQPEGLCTARDLAPAISPEDTDVLEVEAADQHQCLLAGVPPVDGAPVSGALWCWGLNRYGELGTGSPATNEFTREPARVLTGLAVEPDWVRVRVAGVGNLNAARTCGIQVDGSLWCWGRNTFGELGTGEFAPAEPRLLALPGAP